MVIFKSSPCRILFYFKHIVWHQLLIRISCGIIEGKLITAVDFTDAYGQIDINTLYLHL